MIYWKKIDAGNYKDYCPKILEYVIKTIPISSVPFWNPIQIEAIQKAVPELFDGISKFGKVKEIAILVIKVKNGSSIHIDHTVGKNKDVQARMNFPILNVEGTRTAFFELPRPYIDFYTTTPGGTKSWPEFYRNKFKPVTEVTVDSPTILRTSAIHTVYCDTNSFPRITLTVSFEEDLVKYLN